MLPTKPSTNPLKLARRAVAPRLSVRRAADAIGVHFTTLDDYEKEGFDPRKLSVEKIETMAALYGVSPAVLLGRAPFPERPALTAAAS